MARRLFLTMLGLTVASALSAQPATTQLEAVSGSTVIDKTSQTEDIRFKNERNDRMTVPVLLSGTGPYRFLVDTGADRTAISRQLAAKLKLESGNNAALHSVTGVSSVATATVPSLQLTRKSVRIPEAALLDSENMGADGILGVDSLRSQRIMFDFDAQTMSIVPSAAADFDNEPGAIVVRANRRNGRLVLTEATVAGHYLTVVLDTGSQISIGNSALRRQLVGRDGLESYQSVELQSVTGGKLVGDIVIIPEVVIGGVTLGNLAVAFVDAHTFSQLKLTNKPALLLGMNAIRAFKKVSIDFANRKLRVVMPEHSALDTQVASVKL